MMEHKEKMLQDIDNWLKAKGITVWLNWDITDPIERRQAAEYFYSQTESFITWHLNREARRTAQSGGFDVV